MEHLSDNQFNPNLKKIRQLSLADLFKEKISEKNIIENCICLRTKKSFSYVHRYVKSLKSIAYDVYSLTDLISNIIYMLLIKIK